VDAIRPQHGRCECDHSERRTTSAASAARRASTSPRTSRSASKPASGNWKYAGDSWLNEGADQHPGLHVEPASRRTRTSSGRTIRSVLRIGGREGGQDFNQGRISLRNDVTRSGIQAGGDHVFKGGVSGRFPDVRSGEESGDESDLPLPARRGSMPVRTNPRSASAIRTSRRTTSRSARICRMTGPLVASWCSISACAGTWRPT
jgi:hypothetical protein